MSMTTYAREDRPVREPEDPRRAAMARRALSRWALRLALREWKQRVLIVAADRGGLRRDAARHRGRLRDARHAERGDLRHRATLVELPGSTPHLPAVIARIEKAYGTASVVYDQPITTGQAGGADLRAQDPSAPVHAGRCSRSTPAVTRPGRAGGGHVRARPALRPADRLDLARPGRARAPRPAASSPSPASSRTRPTCSTSSPSSRPGQLASPEPGADLPRRVAWTPPPRRRRATSYRRARSSPRRSPKTSVVSPATVVLVVSVLGLVFIGLVATAAFTVMAQRRQRALGMLSSLGATEADVRFVLIVDGLIAGLAGAVIGAAAAAGGWFWYYPHLETATAHRTDPLDLPWAAVVIGLLLAVATVRHRRRLAGPRGQQGAGRRRDLRPGRAAAAWSPARCGPASCSCVGGLFLLFVSGGCERRPATAAGTSILGRPDLLRDRVARCSRRSSWTGSPGWPGAPRWPPGSPLRDLERYRSRSGAALAAVSFAVFIATIAIIIASVRFDDALDYTAPNMASNQLILYAPGNDPTQYQTGQFTPAAKLAADQGSRRTPSPRSCTRPRRSSSSVPVSVERAAARPADPEPVRRRSSRLHGRGFGGLLYVATPALLQGVRHQPERAEPGRRRAHRARRAAVDRRTSRWSAARTSASRRTRRCPAGHVHTEPGHPGGRASCRPAPPCRTP